MMNNKRVCACARVRARACARVRVCVRVRVRARARARESNVQYLQVVNNWPGKAENEAFMNEILY